MYMLRVGMPLLGAFVLGSCGDSNTGKDTVDARSVDADLSTCGTIGRACGAGCPSDLECIGTVCVPVRGQCGGFAGGPCQNATLACTYPTGDSGGICMTFDEKACTCAIAPGALADC
jgi:hypothetical protein